MPTTKEAMKSANRRRPAAAPLPRAKLFANRTPCSNKRARNVSFDGDAAGSSVERAAKTNALRSRVVELEHENMELRRRLHGLTPNEATGRAKDAPCARCKDVRKAKARQAQFLVDRLTASRSTAAAQTERCVQLRRSMDAMRRTIDDMERRHELALSTLRDTAASYERRCGRLERWRSAELAGFRADVAALKRHYADMHKHVLKADLDGATSDVENAMMLLQ